MKNKWKLKNIGRFFEPYKENKRIYLKGVFVSLLWWINWVIHVVFLERFIYYLEMWNEELFKNVLFFYATYLILYDLINYWVKKWWWVELFWWTWKYLSKKYLDKFIKLDNNKIETIWTWKLISIINNGIDNWWFLMWDLIEKWIHLIVSILFAVYMINKVDSTYSLIFILLFWLFFMISIHFNNKMKKYRVRRNENQINVSKNIVKVLMNKNEILQTDKIKSESNLLGKLYQNDTKINKDMSIDRFFLIRNSKIWISLILLYSYYTLWFQFLDWKIQLSLLVWLSSALIITERSISEWISFYSDFTKHFVVIQKFWDLFDSTPNIKWYNNWKKFIHSKWEIKIKNITYWYTEDLKIFNKFNLKITWEKITALVWLSWSWKSTLVKLIAWYLRIDSWKIIIDKQELNKISLKSYYKDIWYLTQEPSVFDWTILENLTYAINWKVEEKKLKKIIKLAKCEFIFELPDWVNTEIWERWIRLSWGQRQRLAIAKIFLKDPKIIILDEPTSALDSFSEEMITKAMSNLFKWRTVIIIAHRLQTVKHADDIILLEGWTIKERWTHKELVKQKWIYNKMLELQSGF